MKLRWPLILLLAAGAAAETRAIFPPGVKPVGPYSPGILAGDFLYVSGQGVRRPDGQIPATFEEQVAQCLDNVKTIVEAGGSRWITSSTRRSTSITWPIMMS